MIDLSTIDTRPARRGYDLQCPICGQWVRVLYILDDWRLVCRECVTRLQNDIKCYSGEEKGRKRADEFRNFHSQ